MYIFCLAFTHNINGCMCVGVCVRERERGRLTDTMIIYMYMLMHDDDDDDDGEEMLIHMSELREQLTGLIWFDFI